MNSELCRRAELLLNRRLDGEIDASESAELNQHLGGCADCKREYRMAAGLNRALMLLEVPDSAVACDRFKARLRSSISNGSVTIHASSTARKRIETLEASRRNRRRMPWVVGLAALVAVSLVAGALGYHFAKQAKQSGVLNQDTVALLAKYPDRNAILHSLNENV